MNTALSEQRIEQWESEGPQYLRLVINHTQTFRASPDVVFPLLCPTAEFDWMDGWHCKLIYSTSLHQEYNAIFKTNYFGFDEVWVVSHFEPNRIIEFTRVSENLSIKVDAGLCDNLDGTTTGNWIINATALTTAGNEALKNMKPEDEPIGVLLGALNYYINNGTIQALPDGIFNKQA